MEEFEFRMVHDGKRNNKEVKIVCDFCGEDSWQRWSRVKKKLEKKQHFFCSRTCTNDWQREERGSKHKGKENARFHFDKSRGVWIAQWWENGKLKNTNKSRWMWEQSKGTIPEGYWVCFKDNNPKNCELDNLKIVYRGERTSEALMGHAVSDEARANMSKVKLGKPLSESHKENIGKATRRLWEAGVFDTPEIREIYAEQGRSTKGSKRNDEQKQHLSEIQLEMYKDPEYRQKQNEARLRGEDHPNWRGGVSEQNYPPEFSKRLRRIIRERDDYRCRVCNHDAKGFAGRVHHIDADKNNNSKGNLILVCKECHGKVHASYETDDQVILAFRSMLNY